MIWVVKLYSLVEIYCCLCVPSKLHLVNPESICHFLWSHDKFQLFLSHQLSTYSESLFLFRHVTPTSDRVIFQCVTQTPIYYSNVFKHTSNVRGSCSACLGSHNPPSSEIMEHLHFKEEPPFIRHLNSRFL